MTKAKGQRSKAKATARKTSSARPPPFDDSDSEEDAAYHIPVASSSKTFLPPVKTKRRGPRQPKPKFTHDERVRNLIQGDDIGSMKNEEAGSLTSTLYIIAAASRTKTIEEAFKLLDSLFDTTEEFLEIVGKMQGEAFAHEISKTQS